MTILVSSPPGIRIRDGFGKHYQGKPSTLRIVDRKQRFPVQAGILHAAPLRRDYSRLVWKSALLDGFHVIDRAEANRICTSYSDYPSHRELYLLDASVPYGTHEAA
jgi:hypothetical protein